jgi:hypothetical protein
MLHTHIFIFILLLSEGQAGEVWRKTILLASKLQVKLPLQALALQEVEAPRIFSAIGA